jgi:hypothetical protein
MFLFCAFPGFAENLPEDNGFLSGPSKFPDFLQPQERASDGMKWWDGQHKYHQYQQRKWLWFSLLWHVERRVLMLKFVPMTFSLLSLTHGCVLGFW